MNATLKTIGLLTFAAFCLTGCAGRVADIEDAAQIQEAAAPADNGWMIEQLKNDTVVRDVSDWPNVYGQGLIIKTVHYDIYTTMSDILMLRQFPVFLESANAAYRRSSGIDTQSNTRYDVYLFETRAQWERFGESFTGELWSVYKKIDKGGYYVNGACVLYNIGRTNTLSILAHEGWHQFSHRHFKYRLPAWLDEGLAMQFEGFSQFKGQYSFEPSLNKMRMAGLKKTLEDGHKLAFTDLLMANPAVVIDGAQADAASNINSYYSRVYALVRFLEEYGGGIYKPAFSKMVSDGCQGKWAIDETFAGELQDRNSAITTSVNSRLGLQVFINYYGSRLQKMEEQYNMYCYSLLIKHRR